MNIILPTYDDIYRYGGARRFYNRSAVRKEIEEAAAPAVAAHSTGGLRRGLAARMGMMGGEGISAKSYVQDGLFHQWDGIENVGFGEHDSNSSTWKDLAGSYDMTLATGSFWNDNCIENDTGNYGLALGPKKVSTPYGTLELLFDYSAVATYLFIVCDPIYNVWGATSRASTGKVSGRTGKTVFFSGYGTIKSVVFTYVDGYDSTSYLNGTAVSDSYSSDYYNGDYVGFSGTGSGRYMRGKAYSARMYNRALTAAEVAANYAIDKARFGLT